MRAGSLLKGSYDKTRLSKFLAISASSAEDEPTKSSVDDDEELSNDSDFESRGNNSVGRYTSDEHDIKYKRLNRLPASLTKKAEVWAITEFTKHTCCEGTTGASAATLQESFSWIISICDALLGHIYICDVLQDCYRGRSVTSAQLTTMLRPKFEAHQRSWGLKEVRVEIHAIDPGAVTIASNVLNALRESHRLPASSEMKLIQSLAVVLRERGWGVVLHTANGSSVQKMALELARKKYHALVKKSGSKKAAKFDAKTMATVLQNLPLFAKEGEGEEISYLVGWTVVPPNMMRGGIRKFLPVDALDGAACRGRGSGMPLAHNLTISICEALAQHIYICYALVRIIFICDALLKAHFHL